MQVLQCLPWSQSHTRRLDRYRLSVLCVRQREVDLPTSKKQTEMILDVNNSFKLKTFLTERRTVPKANSKRQPLVKSTTPFSRPCYVKVGGQSSPLLSNLPINSLWSRYLLIAGILVEHKSQNIFPPNRDLNPNFWIDSPKC